LLLCGDVAAKACIQRGDRAAALDQAAGFPNPATPALRAFVRDFPPPAKPLAAAAIA
jgi:hypothetical protein